jgi:hypothetical protein
MTLECSDVKTTSFESLVDVSNRRILGNGASCRSAVCTHVDGREKEQGEEKWKPSDGSQVPGRTE